jgi:hypothetical protein
MNKYLKYKAEDFATDSSFRRWVLENAEEDTNFWESWLLVNQEKEQEVNEGKSLLLSIFDAFDNISDEEVAEELDKIDHIITRQDEKEGGIWALWNKKIMLLAAAVLVVVGGFGIWITTQKEKNSYENLAQELFKESEGIEKENTSDKLMVITLSDGSSIILHKGAKISYPKKFNHEKREVVLSGEAFFEIAKDPNKPFYVYTNNVVTKVLGTSFLIQEDKNTKDVKVIVRTGKVSVFTRNEENLEKNDNSNLSGLVLTPNQQVEFNAKNQHLVRTLVETPEVITVPSVQQFNFEKTSIADVFSTLEKFYGVKIIYDAEVMKNCYLTASLEDEPLFEKLLLICKTIGARYEVIDAQIIIYSSGCI